MFSKKPSNARDLQKIIEFIREERYRDHTSLKYLTFLKVLNLDYSRFPMPMLTLLNNLLVRPINQKHIPSFPSYPLDVSVDSLSRFLRKKPFRWPKGKKYAVMFTHDVDTSWIFDTNVGATWFVKFQEVEERLGFRSAWYCVPTSIKTAKAQNALSWLVTRGHEVGIHGYSHDPLLPTYPIDKVANTLRMSREHMRRWQSLGYRAPWLARSDTMFTALHANRYLYDSSIPTVDILDKTQWVNSGCCTVFPYMRNGVVELPVTIPQDAMRIRLGVSPNAYWNMVQTLIKKIKAMGGLVVISTHIQPHHSAQEAMLGGYHSVVRDISRDKKAWVALPNDIAKWTKRNNFARG